MNGGDKMAKRYAVVVTFPQAPASCAQIAITETASDPSIAVNRAIKKAMWSLRRATKHRNLTTIGKVSWSLVEDVAHSEPKPQSSISTDADGADAVII
jgi:hypothetical protein